MTSPAERRRPIAVRGSRWAAAIAARLAKAGITPNQISIASLVFAALGALCLWASTRGDMAGLLALVLAALFIEARLLCNLFDGMVAVEGGKAGPAGELFNDVPDRFADAVLLVALGAAAIGPAADALGWLVALLAVLTAYVRTLGTSLGLAPDFSGPMAKPHRMHTLAAAAVISAIAAPFGHAGSVLYGALVIVCLLTALTVASRLGRAYGALMARG